MSRRPSSQSYTFEDCRIIFKNFSGAKGRYNAEGARNFNLCLDEETAQKLFAQGWNVKWPDPKKFSDPDDLPPPRLPVHVEFEKSARPPNIVMITSKGRTKLTADTVGNLDFSRLENIDMIIRGSYWENEGKHGFKAYLQTFYATVVEDELELKYGDTIDSALNAMQREEDDSVPF